MLRIEVVVHNVKDLRSGKVLDKLPELLKRMREMLVRFLGTVQAAHVAFLDEGAFERWSKPTQRGTRRLAGIDLNKARNRHVVDAVVALSTRPGGFTLAQVAEAVQQGADRSLKAYSSRNAAYDLAKLKGKKLVRRVKRSRRYKADPSGVRAMCAYLILRDKVIKPLLAGVVRPFGRSPKVQAPVDQHGASQMSRFTIRRGWATATLLTRLPITSRFSMWGCSIRAYRLCRTGSTSSKRYSQKRKRENNSQRSIA